jgi:hypothetical protein
MFNKDKDSSKNFEFCFLVLSSSGGKPARSVCSMQQALATAVPSSLVSLLSKIFLARGIQNYCFLRVNRVVAIKDGILPSHANLLNSKKATCLN